MSDELQILRKLQRGMVHAKLVKHRVNRFLEGKANGIATERDPENDELVLKAYSRGEVPPSISVLTGECLYQFRSALHHVACHLAERNGKSIAADRNIEFPIRWQDTPNDAKGARWWNERIGKLCAQKQAVIKREQPFERTKHAPRTDPLWLLYELSDFDRHKSVHTSIVATDLFRFETNPPEAKASCVLVSETFGPVDGETEIARYRFEHRGPALTVSVNAEARFNVTFGPGTSAAGLPIVGTLGQIGERVGLLFQELHTPCP
jgi:hypothetical protein